MNLNRSLDFECNPDWLIAFLNGSLSTVESDQLKIHLDGCPECQQKIEAQAAHASFWGEAKSMLSDVQLPPTTEDVVGSGNRQESGSESLMVAAVLEQLVPSESLNRLGRIDHYEIIGVIGSGAMGVVLKAMDTLLDRVVAIKVLAPHLAYSGVARKRFEREAKAAAAVLHPNVIPLHAVSAESHQPYLVMPYIRGGSLQARIQKEGPLRLVEILRIGQQVAAGLAAAHEQGLVHRDVKPANILLEQGVERVTITDFGLARFVGDTSLTQLGAIAGTPQFMSPEQARGEPIDQRSDLFSLGCLLYTLATGSPPFSGASSFTVLKKICEDTPKDLWVLNPDIPVWFGKFVGDLMAKNPAARIQSATEVAKQLAAALAHVQQPSTVPLPKTFGRTAGNLTVLRSSTFIGAVLMSLVLIALWCTFVWSPLQGPQDYVERDGKSRYIQHLLANWKASKGDSSQERVMTNQIFEFHRVQAGEAGTAEFLETKKRWANELLPLLLSGVSEEKAKILIELTQPFDAIVEQNLQASKGMPTEPVGWEWQEVHMLALGRAGLIDDAYKTSEVLVNKVRINLKANPDLKADFFGKQRSAKEIIRECLVHRQVVEMINGPASKGPANGVEQTVIDAESSQQMDAIKVKLGQGGPSDRARSHFASNDDTNREPMSGSLSSIPDRPSLLQASEKYLAIFEVNGDRLVSKAIRKDTESGELGVLCWQRLTNLFPTKYRTGLVQFNVLDGRRLAGFFAGSGKNDVARKGYSLAIAKYAIQGQPNLDADKFSITAKRGHLDWTLIHEMGHYICLTTNAIELFSAKFEGHSKQPVRRKKPDDYPADGSPVVDGNFVTSYAERSTIDEETCETFTTYLTIKKLPSNGSLVCEKILFFDSLPGYPELRKHIQTFVSD